MKRRNVGAIVALLCVMLLAIMACNRPDHHGTGNEGQALELTFPDLPDTGGFGIEVTPQLCAGDPDAGVLPEPIVVLAGISDPLPGGDAVIDVGTDPQSQHRVGQLNIPLNVGCYDVQAFPILADGGVSSQCTATKIESFELEASETEQVVLISQCVGDGNGVLDVAVVENQTPLLSMEEVSTLTSQCEVVEVCFQVLDPDSDPYELVWDPSPGVTLGDETVTEEGGIFRHCRDVSSTETGNYDVVVTVHDLDGNGNPFEDSLPDGGVSSVSLEFTLYVASGPCFHQTPEAIWPMGGGGPHRTAQATYAGTITLGNLGGTADLPFPVSGGLAVDDQQVIYVPSGYGDSDAGFVNAFTYSGSAFQAYWQSPNLGKDIWGNLAVDGTQVYLQTLEHGVSPPRLCALNKTTGAINWQVDLVSSGFLTPILANGRVYISRGEIEAYGLDGSGPDVFSGCPNYGEIAIDVADTVYAGCEGKVQAIDFAVTPPVLKWEYTLTTDHVGQTIMIDGMGSVFATSYNAPASSPNLASVIRLNASSGTQVWKRTVSVSGFFKRSSLTYAGRVFLVDDAGVARSFYVADGSDGFGPANILGTREVHSQDIVVDPAGTGYASLDLAGWAIFPLVGGSPYSSSSASPPDDEMGTFAILEDGTMITTRRRGADGGPVGQGRLYAFKP